MSPRVEESVTALNGISAPRLDVNKSWANDLINGAPDGLSKGPSKQVPKTRDAES